MHDKLWYFANFQVIQEEDNRQPDVTFSDKALRSLDNAIAENWFLETWTHPDEINANEIKRLVFYFFIVYTIVVLNFPVLQTARLCL